MPRRSCSVLGCEDRYPGHSFPNPERDLHRFQVWIEACGREDLVSLPPKKVYPNRRVCSRHFCKEDFLSNNRLLSSAYPKLFIPKPLPDILQSQEISIEIIFTEHSYALSPHDANVAPLPSSSPVANTEFSRTELCSISDIEELVDSPATTCTGSSTSSDTASVCLTPTKCKRKLLASINVSRQADLTPKAKLLYKQACYFKRKAASNARCKLSFKERLRAATKMSKNEALIKATSTMDKIRTRFFTSQIESCGKKARGCRFSIEDKVLALTLYKQSGSAYKLLRKIFALPSRGTLLKLCSKIPVEPGFNQCIFDVLKAEVDNFKNPLDKYCVLLFDEMSIAPNLNWNGYESTVHGFEDFGYKRSQKLANHVQVFMVRGVQRKWKQQVFYNFVHSATKPADIVRILKELIQKLKECGLYILATICDQGTNNVGAINMLIEDTSAQYLRRGEAVPSNVFEVARQQIVPLYDPPHLLKGLRNNLLTKDLQFRIENKTLTAKWEHISTAFSIDSPSSGSLRLMNKLTEYHVDPKKIKKMKVSCCAQVFSHKVASAIQFMADQKSTSKTDHDLHMPPEGADTAKLLEFVDNLFDSVNGTAYADNVGKPLRTAVSHSSRHLSHWVESLKVLKSMKFVCPIKKKTSVPPSVKHWVSTIAGFITLWHKMRALNFKRMKPRCFNQDPLENFFGRLRQRGMRFTNPTPAAFTQHYKSLLMTTLTSPHSVGANCEEDDSTILVTLQKFVTQNLPKGFVTETVSELPVLPASFQPLKKLELVALQYVAGFVTHKLLPKFGKCRTCRENIVLGTHENLTTQSFTRALEYAGQKPKCLKYCNDSFLNTMTIIYNIIKTLLPLVLHQHNFYNVIISKLKEYVVWNFKECAHTSDLCNFIITYFAKIVIHHHINSVNNILHGKDDRIKETTSDLFKSVIEMRKKMLKRPNNS